MKTFVIFMIILISVSLSLELMGMFENKNYSSGEQVVIVLLISFIVYYLNRIESKQ